MQCKFFKKAICRVSVHTILVCYIIGLIASCAQVTAPTGGKKDTTPPLITLSEPANYSTNFDKHEIRIRFNEWIQPLTNPSAQVIISPVVDPFPKIDISRNELSIRFKDTLPLNTTYRLFFADNIKDNNEGNTLQNFKYLFSTGTYIDSLQIKGNIQTDLDKFPDNTYLLMYQEKEDSVFTQKRPFYITKVSSTGNFSMENIKEGDYSIFALSDKNGNYYYDLPTEAIAFTDSFMHINTTIDSLNMVIFLPEDSLIRIYDFDRIIKGGIMHLTFNKELSFTKDEVTVAVVEDENLAPIAFQDKEAKKMTLYLPKLENDTNSFTLIIRNNGQLVDTIRVRSESKHYIKPVPFFNDTVLFKTLSVLQTQPLRLMSSYYCIERPDTSRIEITDTAGTSILFSIVRAEDMQTYFISANWSAGMKYQLHFLDSAFVDLAGNYSKKQEFSFLATSTKKAGNLLITYNLPVKNKAYISILKDNSGKVLDKQILRDSQEVKINYGLLPAGNYSVEVIEDINDNGIWNSGSFKYRTLPEKIYKEKKPIIIKENWDAEETISVDFTKKVATLNTAPDDDLDQRNPISTNKRLPVLIEK